MSGAVKVSGVSAIIARALNQMGGRAGFCDELAGAIIASLDSAGIALMPKEPTDVMLKAAWPHAVSYETLLLDYRAMLAARPK